MDESQAFIAIAGRRCRRLGRQAGSEELAQLLEPDFGIFMKIQGASMLAIAAIGIAVNLVSMRLLPQDSSDRLNVRGAYLGWLLAVIVAAGIIMATG